jgi:pimeloyl-ACP methyl ester carboxylesterase
MSEHPARVTDVGQLAYDVHGAGSPLLFIHGLTFDRSTWEPIVERLADRYTCVAVDLPGHGGSEGSSVRRLDDVAAAVQHLLGQLQLDPPVVVGHSMGGALAAMYAAAYPTRGVVLVDQAPYLRPFATMLHQFEPALRSEDFHAAFEPIRTSIGVELLPEPQRSSILASQRIDQELILSYWEEVLAATPDELQARIDRTAKTISVPMLIVFGQAVDSATDEYLRGHMPSAEIEEWAGLGHMVHLMEPDRFARRLTEFAERCFSTSA